MKSGFQKPNHALTKLSFALLSDRNVLKNFRESYVFHCLVINVHCFLLSFDSLFTLPHLLLFVNNFFEVFSNSLKMKFCHPCWRLDYFIISSFICQHFFIYFCFFLLCHTILYTHFFEACFSIPFLSALRQAPFYINFCDTFADFYMTYCILQIPSSHCNI